VRPQLFIILALSAANKLHLFAAVCTMPFFNTSANKACPPSDLDM